MKSFGLKKLIHKYIKPEFKIAARNIVNFAITNLDLNGLSLKNPILQDNCTVSREQVKFEPKGQTAECFKK